MPTYAVVNGENAGPLQHPAITLVDPDGSPYSPEASIPDGTYVEKITGLTTGGVVDNTATLQARLSAIAAAGGGIGRLPIGTFLTEMPAIPSNVTLEGSGWGTVLLLKPQIGGAAGQAFSAVGIYGTVGAHVSNAHIRNLCVDGNVANHTAPAYTDQEGIQLKYADNCSVTGCLVKNAVADGIDADYAVDCLIADNVTKNCGGSGIHMSDGCTGNIVRGNIATGNGATFSRAGISDYSNASDNTFLGNVSHDNYRNYELIGFRERFGPSNASYGTVTAADILTGMADANKLLIGGAPFVNYMQSGSYYGPLGQTSSGANAAGVLTVAPLFVPRPLALDRIATRVTLAAGSSVVRLGIYNDDGTGKPGTLVLDAGTVDSTVSGDKELTIAQNLRPGLYWLAAVSQGGAPTLRTMDGQMPSMGAILLAEALTTPSGCYTQTGVTGALPTPFGTPVIGKTPGRVVVRVV
jgi:parallel beta-helix repeat protein